MKLWSVNVSLPKAVPHGNETIVTGIFKKPVEGRVWLGTLGVEGDGQGDLRVHGGPDRAAYAYDIAHYDHWKRELNRDDFEFGQFGENLTVEGMLDDAVCVGDRFRIGGATVEATHPRIPCFKLAMKMGRPDFIRRFLTSGRVGFYLRVLEEGIIGAGDPIETLHLDPERLSIWEVCRYRALEPDNRDGARRALRVDALAEDWKNAFRERLAQANSG